MIGLSNDTKMAALRGGKDELLRHELRRFFAILVRYYAAGTDKYIYLEHFEFNFW